MTVQTDPESSPRLALLSHQRMHDKDSKTSSVTILSYKPLYEQFDHQHHFTIKKIQMGCTYHGISKFEKKVFTM